MLKIKPPGSSAGSDSEQYYFFLPEACFPTESDLTPGSLACSHLQTLQIPVFSVSAAPNESCKESAGFNRGRRACW